MENNIEQLDIERNDKEITPNFLDKNFKLSEENEFNFNILNWKVDGMIFVTTIFLVPFFASLLGYILVKFDENLISEKIQVYNLIIYIISVGIGFIFNWIRNSKVIFKKGFFWIYLFIIAPYIISLLINIIASPIIKDNENKKPIEAMLSLIVMIIAELLIIIFAIIFDKKIFNRIKETFKTKWKQLIVVAIVGTIILFLVANLLMGFVVEGLLLKAEQSDNENSLKQIIKGEYGQTIKITYAILLFLLTVVIAPFCEEICFRNSFFLNASNKWLGLIFGGLYFGFVHYGLTFDFIHFFSYSSAGFILSGVFVLTKGNITFSWTIHMLNNLIAYILMFH